MISLGPPTRALCFSFEYTHNYSKDISGKKRFKNLLISLARHHQKMECCNNKLTPDSHLFFGTGKKFSVIN